MTAPTHLVIVCCHGIWQGGPELGADESEWLIADFQTGETPTFIEHIKAGLRCIAEDEDAILMFSGGPTRKETQLSEAQSYSNLAAANAYFSLLPADANTRARIFTEERALDSYHNVLLSLTQFWRTHAAWPRTITIVSHGFKRARLVDGHCAAIGFPLDRVAFVGIDPPGMAVAGPGHEVEKVSAMDGVRRAVDEWRDDPHGVGDVLAGKRARRNPWGISQDLFLSEDERRRSGLVTRRLDNGGEALVDDSNRPWL